MPTITVIEVAPNHYLGVTTLGELAGNLVDPRRVDHSTQLERARDPLLSNAWQCRGDLQRKFDKPRTKRSAKFARYIRGVLSGAHMGVIPPITLWTSDLPAYDGHSHTLNIRSATMFVASDGETQLAARYMLANGYGEPGDADFVKGDRNWLDEPFAVVISTGSSTDAAMKALYDANTYATPIKAIVTNAMNLDGALTIAVNAGVAASKIDRTRIKLKGNLGNNKKYTTLMSTLFHGAIGVVYGTDAMLKSNPSTRINEANEQFGNLGGADAEVTAFIRAVLVQPDAVVHEMDPAHMLALGVHYKNLQTLHPISAERCLAIADAWKLKHSQRRILTRVWAELIYREMMRTPAQKAA